MTTDPLVLCPIYFFVIQMLIKFAFHFSEDICQSLIGEAMNYLKLLLYMNRYHSLISEQYSNKKGPFVPSISDNL